jgi:predicted Zn finger-like uncharacterized protein
LKLHCVACQTAFKLEADQINVNGSMIRCLLCNYIFTIYPPGANGLPVTQDTKIDQSILVDLFEMQDDPRAQISIQKISENEFNAMVDNKMSGGAWGDEDSSLAPDEAEYADLPDLSELENMIDWDDIKDLDEPPHKSIRDFNDPHGFIAT